MIKLGVMGCANIAQRSMIPAIIASKDVELIAVASRDIGKAKTLAEKFDCEAIEGYDHLINHPEVDAIYMPLPTGLHEEWAIKSIKQGKHVLLEKSLALNLASAMSIVEAAKEKDVLIMENFMFLYHGQHQYIKKLIKKGVIGELRCFRSSFGFPPLDSENFRYNKELGGGALLDAGAYTLRASQLFMEGALAVKSASLSINQEGVDIYGGAHLQNEKNVISQVSFGFDNFYQCNYELWGSKGKITAHRAFTPGPDFEPLITIETPEGKEEVRFVADDHFANIVAEFAKCVQTQEYESKYDEILAQSKLIDAVRKKADEK